jgi:peptidoglycan/LPS O-acetylase OafA/YrhL
MRSLSDAMRETAAGASGFDYLRVILAFYVVLSHAFAFAEPSGEAPWLWSGWFGPFHRAALPMFFALSGFLVSGSFERNSLPRFVALRALRIVPALAVETVLAAVLLGAMFTTLPLGRYFASPGFEAYFLNILGDIHFYLPGVFEGMRVNPQLWTVPYELECYLCLIGLGFLRSPRLKYLLLLMLTVVSLQMTYMAHTQAHMNTGPAAPRLTLVAAFLWGVCLYMFRDRVFLGLPMLTAAALSSYVALYVPELAFLAPAPLAYLTVFFGMTRPPRLPFGDLSYGMYLYHGPILGSFVHLFAGRLHWFGLLGLGLPTTMLFALASWSWVERPILGAKSKMLALVDRLAALPATLSPARVAR